MKNLESYKVIFWDFDGVILDSMSVRNLGFEEVLKLYPKNQVTQLIDYHKKNGGLSRYHKLRYFFEEIRAESVSEADIKKLSNEFSIIMRKRLCNRDLLIIDSLNFIKKQYKKYRMHVVSGSDGEELRYLCGQLKIDYYFKTIEGSPKPKTVLVKNIINHFGYDKCQCSLIGDSINDFDAADANNIDFFGYNNVRLKEFGVSYIDSFYVS